MMGKSSGGNVRGKVVSAAGSIVEGVEVLKLG
jgi:hypothetical protein